MTLTTDIRARCPSVYPKGMLEAPREFQLASGVWGYVACCTLHEGECRTRYEAWCRSEVVARGMMGEVDRGSL